MSKGTQSKVTKSSKKENKSTKKVEIKWDHLIDVYKDIGQHLGTVGKALLEFEKNYKKVLDKDEELRKEFLSVTMLLEEHAKELVKILSLHSKYDKETNTLTPFGGVIKETDGVLDVYLNATLAYDGLNEKITNISEITFAHLLGLANASIKKYKIEMNPKENKNDGTK